MVLATSCKPLWLLLVVLALSGTLRASSQSPLGYTYCAGIADSDSRNYCLQYVNSNESETKWNAAVLWSKYRPGHYQCANITAYCIVADMQGEQYGSSCTVAADGAPCKNLNGAVGSCWQGMCGDPERVAVNMLLAADGLRPEALPWGQQTQQFREQGPSMGALDYDQLTFQQATAADDYSYSDDDPPRGSSSGGPQQPPLPQQPPPRTQITDPSDPYGLNIQLPPAPKITDPFTPRPPSPPPPFPPPPPPPPVEQRASLTVDIQPDSFTGVVPASFLGISREWTQAVWWDKNLPAFGNIFDVLGPAPVIRFGGASQEALLQPPNSTYINSLITLHCALGVRFIIGLPLFQNAPMLSLAVKKTFDDAFKDYPFAILSYELGNEPNYWPGTKQGGFQPLRGAQKCVPVQYNDPAYELVGTMDAPTDKAGGAPGYAIYKDYKEPYVPYKPSQYCYTPESVLFVSGTESYQSYFARAARIITGCGGLQSEMQALWGFPYWGPPGFNRQVISGPSWGDFSSFPTEQLATFLKNSDQCYLSEVTMHYYGPNRNTTFKALFDNLLARPIPDQPEGPTNKALISVVKSYIDAARVANVALRVSESNSVPDGGQSNFSNTLGAALWTVSTAMEFARAGASGINFHWGNGGVPPDPGRAPAYIGVQTLFENDDWNKPQPAVRIPWYGYVMFSRALGNNGPGMFLNYTTNVKAASSDAICREQIYYYPLLVPHAGMVSLVVANVNPNVTCEFTATLPGVLTSAAVLQRLEGPKGLDSVPGVTLAGQTYEQTRDGKMRGQFTPELVQPHQESIRQTGWTFDVRPGSGVLVQIPLAAGTTNQLGMAPTTPSFVAGGAQQAAPVASATWQPPQALQQPPVQGGVATAAGGGGSNAGAVAAGAAGQQPVDGAAAGAGVGPNSAAALGLSPQDTAGLGNVYDPAAGQYVFKGTSPDGSPIYTWKPNAAAPGSSSSSSSGGGSSGGGMPAAGGVPMPAAGMAAYRPGSGSLSTSGMGADSSSSRYGSSAFRRSSGSTGSSGSKPAGGIGSLFGGLFGRGRRLLGGVLDAALPASMHRVLLNQLGSQYAAQQQQFGPPLQPAAVGSLYNAAPSNSGPGQQAAAGSAASQWGAPAASGVGRAWPQNANTSNMDVGMYGLGGYTLFPPGYDQAAVARAAAQCPGIARIQAIQARASSKKRL